MSDIEDFVAGKKRADVLGASMAFRETGTGRAIVFLHGNPTSSFLWRNVIGHLESLGRCVAPDLIGMGDSAKVPSREGAAYRFVEHRRYLDALLDALDLGDEIIFVLHDWGSALGFDWAHRHPDRVAGIAYMEAIVAPVASWADWPADAQRMFQGLRSDAGETMVLDKNLFVERILPASIQRELTEPEMAEYRRPYPDGESRWPTLQWPREIPIEGEPADVSDIVAAYADWLQTATVPTLFINADPGSILVGKARERCRTWPEQTEVTVPGVHFLQEDSPQQIGQALAAWIPSIRPT